MQIESQKVVSILDISENCNDKIGSQANEQHHREQALQNQPQVCVSNLQNPIYNSQFTERTTLQQAQFIKEELNEQGNQISEQNNEESKLSQSQKIHTPMKNVREQKFKRSTNNSHKKFISVARRWMFKNNCFELKTAFQNKFASLKSTRTYFFIILAFIKSAMTLEKQEQFKAHFTKQVQSKINFYEKQIEFTVNQNLKHFRGDEITDLKFSIKAFNLFFQGDIEKSIQCIYKKDKTAIVKKQHYEEALKTVKSFEEYFRGQNSVVQMIQTFGTSKKRNVRDADKSAIPSQLKLYAQKMKSKNQFFFPEMFGLRSCYIFDSKPIQKQIIQVPKKTKDTDEIEQESQSCSSNSKKNQQMIQNQENLQAGSKKTSNIFVLIPAPNNQINELLSIQKFTKDSPLTGGFRPFQNS